MQLIDIITQSEAAELLSQEKASIQCIKQTLNENHLCFCSSSQKCSLQCLNATIKLHIFLFLIDDRNNSIDVTLKIFCLFSYKK